MSPAERLGHLTLAFVDVGLASGRSLSETQQEQKHELDLISFPFRPPSGRWGRRMTLTGFQPLETHI